MKKEIGRYYQRIVKNSLVKEIKNGLKINQEELDIKWNEEMGNFVSSSYLFNSKEENKINRKTKILLNSQDYNQNVDKILEVFEEIRNTYYRLQNKKNYSEDYLFENLLRVIVMIFLTSNLKKATFIIVKSNQIALDFIKDELANKNYERVNKFLRKYYAVKLEIIFELKKIKIAKKTNIINRLDETIYKEVLYKIPKEDLDKTFLDLGILFSKMELFKLDRDELFLMSKELIKMTRDDYLFDEYSDAVYIYEKNKGSRYTLGRRMLDYFCGFGEHPINIFKVALITNMVVCFIFYIDKEFSLNYLELTNIRKDNTLDFMVDVIYFNVTTLFTVGYGDIFPLNSITKLLVVFQQVTGFIFTTSFITLFLRKLFRYWFVVTYKNFGGILWENYFYYPYYY